VGHAGRKVQDVARRRHPLGAVDGEADTATLDDRDLLVRVAVDGGRRARVEAEAPIMIRSRQTI